jgi:hypothetical protein
MPAAASLAICSAFQASNPASTNGAALLPPMLPPQPPPIPPLPVGFSSPLPAGFSRLLLVGFSKLLGKSLLGRDNGFMPEKLPLS